MTMDVFSLHRLLDPMKIVVGEPSNAPTGFDRIKRLIVVDHLPDIRADHFPDRSHSPLVLIDVSVAELYLDRSEPLSNGSKDFIFICDGIDVP
jgi:hypothetical protein